MFAHQTKIYILKNKEELDKKKYEDLFYINIIKIFLRFN
jgi:hypothetical protein